MITYSNITDRVIDGMSDILNTEFPSSQINLDKIRPNSFLITPEEENYAKKRIKDPKFKPYLSTITSNPSKPKPVTRTKSPKYFLPVVASSPTIHLLR